MTKRRLNFIFYWSVMFLISAGLQSSALAATRQESKRNATSTAPKRQRIDQSGTSHEEKPSDRIAAPQSMLSSPAIAKQAVPDIPQGQALPEGESSGGQQGLEQTREPTQAPQAATTYEIPWQSVNGGGTPASSSNYELNSSASQSVIGLASSVNYEMGAGYWYGTTVTGNGGCNCPFQSDFDEDGFLTALDLGAMIDILFGGSADVKDPDCPSPRADFDCDSFSTALDLGALIDHLFAGGSGPCNPCSP